VQVLQTNKQKAEIAKFCLSVARFGGTTHYNLLAVQVRSHGNAEKMQHWNHTRREYREERGLGAGSAQESRKSRSCAWAVAALSSTCPCGIVALQAWHIVALQSLNERAEMAKVDQQKQQLLFLAELRMRSVRISQHCVRSS